MTNNSGEYITSCGQMDYSDLRNYFGSQLKTEFYLNNMITYHYYFFCNDIQNAIDSGNLSSFYSLKNEGLNINFKTTDIQA